MSTSLNSNRGAGSADPLAPLRYTDGGGTDFELQLLGAAIHDPAPAPSPERLTALLDRARGSRQDLARAGSAREHPGVTGANGAAHGWKPWAAGIVGASIIGAVVVSQWPTGAVPAEASQPAMIVDAPARARDEAGPGMELTGPPVDERAPVSSALEVAIPQAEAVVGQRARPEPRRRPASGALTPTASPALEPPSNLAAEVRAIESIQTLLGWGQARQAADAIAQYRRVFPAGELSLEADLLEIDVALARGDRRRGAELARALLERPAASRYRARLGQLIGAESLE